MKKVNAFTLKNRVSKFFFLFFFGRTQEASDCRAVLPTSKEPTKLFSYIGPRFVRHEVEIDVYGASRLDTRDDCTALFFLMSNPCAARTFDSNFVFDESRAPEYGYTHKKKKQQQSVVGTVTISMTLHLPMFPDTVC